MLIGAPTGSGKTIVAILKLLQDIRLTKRSLEFVFWVFESFSFRVFTLYFPWSLIFLSLVFIVLRSSSFRRVSTNVALISIIQSGLGCAAESSVAPASHQLSLVSRQHTLGRERRRNHKVSVACFPFSQLAFVLQFFLSPPNTDYRPKKGGSLDQERSQKSSFPGCLSCRPLPAIEPASWACRPRRRLDSYRSARPSQLPSGPRQFTFTAEAS